MTPGQIHPTDCPVPSPGGTWGQLCTQTLVPALSTREDRDSTDKAAKLWLMYGYYFMVVSFPKRPVLGLNESHREFSAISMFNLTKSCIR